jgi:hypothetical protein
VKEAIWTYCNPAPLYAGGWRVRCGRQRPTASWAGRVGSRNFGTALAAIDQVDAPTRLAEGRQYQRTKIATTEQGEEWHDT